MSLTDDVYQFDYTEVIQGVASSGVEYGRGKPYKGHIYVELGVVTFYPEPQWSIFVHKYVSDAPIRLGHLSKGTGVREKASFAHEFASTDPSELSYHLAIGMRSLL